MDCINDSDCPKFRPFISHTQRITKVKKAKYSTSLDPRGYIPVYEYLINGQPIMWDRESGYVHFTGIWKSLGNSKADIVKMVDSNPELRVKKIRGGFLKIQGTWIPYEFAYILCKRTAWAIRKELFSIFGPRFVEDVLDPSHPEYGCLLLDPKNASFQKSTSSRRTSFSTAMRQASSRPFKREFMRDKVPRDKAGGTQNNLPRNKKHAKAASSMSLSRLLNSTETQSHESIDQQMMDYRSEANAFSDSPNTTPSPTFRAIPHFSFDSSQEKRDRLLPPIYTSTIDRRLSEPRITPIYSPSSTASSWSPVSSSTEIPSVPTCERDIIETINATLLLQRLSQDDGVRPFKPLDYDFMPDKVTVGNQEFRIHWDDC
ncbi:transcription regulator HTH, apses-type DNA-binding domain-containing protein [Blakeslea trispora]|nr:transcription regulator HTH, apses-type DNA-binding domain-containing protein [Blakeslea trispora]